MPDRDYLTSGRSRGWGAAITLFTNEGVRPEVVTAATRALVRELRELGIEAIGQRDFRESVDGVLSKRFFGPTKFAGLVTLGVDAYERRHREMQIALESDIALIHKQFVRTGKLRAPPRKRLSAQATAEIAINILHSDPR